MKQLFFILTLMGILVACTKDKTIVSVVDGECTISVVDTSTQGLVDEWKLIEILVDPGNGSGTFSPVTSNKTIEFHSNGTVSSNGNLCSMNEASSTASSGTYSTINSTISSSACTNLHFTLSTNYLIIDYPCIEPCRARFQRQ